MKAKLVKESLYEYNDDHIYSDYEKDEDGNLLSCCGDILDKDVMRCPTCGEHQ